MTADAARRAICAWLLSESRPSATPAVLEAVRTRATAFADGGPHFDGGLVVAVLQRLAAHDQIDRASRLLCDLWAAVAGREDERARWLRGVVRRHCRGKGARLRRLRQLCDLDAALAAANEADLVALRQAPSRAPRTDWLVPAWPQACRAAHATGREAELIGALVREAADRGDERMWRLADRVWQEAARPLFATGGGNG